MTRPTGHPHRVCAVAWRTTTDEIGQADDRLQMPRIGPEQGAGMAEHGGVDQSTHEQERCLRGPSNGSQCVGPGWGGAQRRFPEAAPLENRCAATVIGRVRCRRRPPRAVRCQRVATDAPLGSWIPHPPPKRRQTWSVAPSLIDIVRDAGLQMPLRMVTGMTETATGLGDPLWTVRVDGRDGQVSRPQIAGGLDPTSWRPSEMLGRSWLQSRPVKRHNCGHVDPVLAGCP